jgi:molecular chaperone IbpA
MNALTQLENAILRHGIGIDGRFFERVAAENTGFPPHNIEELAEDRFRVTLAIAGFAKEDITITLQNDLLMVEGTNSALTAANGRPMLYKGIAMRNFSRSFKIGEHVSVERASLVNGLLQIELVREIPEVMKARQIALS